ncbi:Dephospho-CoA kinase [Astathelohania contejeani]|uniref:Dephospho-CoA kinase n=1 Tax=Astathelohania contejeani TaxID=164912 RepID=A0ABQ7I1M5_9MICR|nr:Dephospho-CoA kinase [Thelohania contejeani]
MKIICITGCVGTGKTTVSNLLRKRGYPVLDIDGCAKELIKLKHIDEKICSEYNTSTKNFKHLIFTNENCRKRLKIILYPRIFIKISYEVIKLIFKGHGLIFLDIPLFFELKLNYFFDSLVVYCNRTNQITRIEKRDGKRYKNEKLDIQWDIETKIKMASIVIDNNESLEKTEKQLDNLKFNKISIYFYIFFFLSLYFINLPSHPEINKI